MKLVLFSRNGEAPAAGVLRGDAVSPVRGFEGPTALVDLIDRGGEILPEAETIPLREVQLLAPIPRPGKIVCSMATYGGEGERVQLLLTLKSAESVIGPGQTVQLPTVATEWSFVPEAELGLVIKGPAKSIKAADWRSVVFGYTCFIDVMAQGDAMLGRDFWLSKADTLGPLGPCIVTADEIADPQSLSVTSKVNGRPAQEYSMKAADYSIGEHVELATTIMTLHTGDILTCGTSRVGLVPLGNGDEVQVEIGGIGELGVRVQAPAGVAV
jgi:2-keto-4-pentenoate hydratase/2-oxohepta-3-ene-1,7-dioic acid hydratase in catechol pathway